MPFALFVRGSLKALQSPCLSIVGTRSMTSYGKYSTRQITKECCNAGITIISGLALGIDGEAHQAALEAQGKTIAVLGSGVNPENVYPRQHAQLAEEIIRKGGALISESAPGYKALYFDFPLRNRIIAGLSQATLLVEGAHKSGSLITAHLATELGKDVLAVPGPINAQQSEGTNALIKNGAIPCLGIDTILETLHLEPSIAPQESVELTSEERSVLAQITHPKQLDEIARELQQPISSILRLVSHLELKGFLHHSDSRHIVRTTRKF
jgi:DNA processing protein